MGLGNGAVLEGDVAEGGSRMETSWNVPEKAGVVLSHSAAPSNCEVSPTFSPEAGLAMAARVTSRGWPAATADKRSAGAGMRT